MTSCDHMYVCIIPASMFYGRSLFLLGDAYTLHEIGSPSSYVATLSGQKFDL